MTIEFSDERWQHVKSTYRQWWDGTLDRPLLPVVVGGRDSLVDQQVRRDGQWPVELEALLDVQHLAITAKAIHGG